MAGEEEGGIEASHLRAQVANDWKQGTIMQGTIVRLTVLLLRFTGCQAG